MMIRVLVIVGRVFGWVPGIFDLIIDRYARPRLSNSTKSARWSGHDLVFQLSDYTQRKAYFSCFERREIRFVGKRLNESDIAIDVGANVGLLTIPIARAVGPSGKVLAFEPIPDNYQRLISAVSKLPQIRAMNVACSNDSNQFLDLYRVQNEGSDSASTSGSFTAFPHGEKSSKVSVKCVRLEPIINELCAYQSPVSFMKVDVEGAEEQVLLGCGSYLGPNFIKSLMLEAVVWKDGFRTEDKKVFAILRRAGYEIHPLSVLGKPMRCTLENYVHSPFHHPVWALRLVSSLSLNYCAIRSKF